MSIYDGRKPEPPYPTWKDLEDEITSLKSQLEDAQIVLEMAKKELQVERELKAKMESQLEQAQRTVELYEKAIAEAEAIFGGEYADNYGPMFELAVKAREARAALERRKQ